MKTCLIQSGALGWMRWMLAACLLPSLAYAHDGVNQTHGFAHGFMHPLAGLDPIAAMAAPGVYLFVS